MAGLRELFDYQKFVGVPRLDAMCEDVVSRYGRGLSIHDLELISAAGTPDMTMTNKDLEG